jgi:hypothetical protein
MLGYRVQMLQHTEVPTSTVSDICLADRNTNRLRLQMDEVICSNSGMVSCQDTCTTGMLIHAVW